MIGHGGKGGAVLRRTALAALAAGLSSCAAPGPAATPEELSRIFSNGGLADLTCVATGPRNPVDLADGIYRVSPAKTWFNNNPHAFCSVGLEVKETIRGPRFPQLVIAVHSAFLGLGINMQEDKPAPRDWVILVKFTDSERRQFNWLLLPGKEWDLVRPGAQANFLLRLDRAGLLGVLRPENDPDVVGAALMLLLGVEGEYCLAQHDGDEAAREKRRREYQEMMTKIKEAASRFAADERPITFHEKFQRLSELVKWINRIYFSPPASPAKSAPAARLRRGQSRSGYGGQAGPYLRRVPTARCPLPTARCLTRWADTQVRPYAAARCPMPIARCPAITGPSPDAYCLVPDA